MLREELKKEQMDFFLEVTMEIASWAETKKMKELEGPEKSYQGSY